MQSCLAATPRPHGASRNLIETVKTVLETVVETVAIYIETVELFVELCKFNLFIMLVTVSI